MILVVCTANISRSPAAERMFKAAFGSRANIPVVSEGTQGMTGFPIDKNMAELLVATGLKASGHSASSLRVESIENAELIVTMTRHHRSKVISLVPSAKHKTFTLLEFAELTRDSPRTESFTALSARRARIDTEPADLDIADPYGLGPREYFHAFTQMQDAVCDIVTWLTGSATQLTSAPAPALTAMSTDAALGDEPVGLSLREFSWKDAARADYDVLYVPSPQALLDDRQKCLKLLKKLSKSGVAVVGVRGPGVDRRDEAATQLAAATSRWIEPGLSGAKLHRELAMALPIASRS